MQGANEKGEAIDALFVASLLFMVFVLFFIFWFPSMLDQEGKGLLDLISPLRTVLVFWLAIKL